MKKMMLALGLLLTVGQVQCFHLTARGVEPIELKSETSFFVFGKKDGFYEVTGATENDLNHLRAFLMYRSDLHGLDTNQQLNFDERKRINEDYSGEWLRYAIKSINGRELTFLTKQSFLLFSKEPVIDGLQHLWNNEIEKNKIALDEMLGIFRGQGLSDNLCRSIYDAYAVERRLKSSGELISGAIAGSSLNGSGNSGVLKPELANRKKKNGDDAPLLQSLIGQGSGIVDLDLDNNKQNDSEQDNSEKKPDNKFTQLISRVSRFWKQCDPLEKWAYSGFALFAFFTLHKLSQRG